VDTRSKGNAGLVEIDGGDGNDHHWSTLITWSAFESMILFVKENDDGLFFEWHYDAAAQRLGHLLLLVVALTDIRHSLLGPDSHPYYYSL
jgi:hypothetical protein